MQCRTLIQLIANATLSLLGFTGCGTTPPSGNSVPPVIIKMVDIPAGEFMMGSSPSEKNRSDGDYQGLGETQHRVKLTQRFRMGIYEVTQREWMAVSDEAPWKGKRFALEGPDLPATYVSWNDAVKFCELLTSRERLAGRIKNTQVYRLPTEAEWEYACRAGTTTAYTFGDDHSQLSEYAVLAVNKNSAGESSPHPVGMSRPNPWGLYDMHGNASEWCADWNGEYPAGAAIDPQGPESGNARTDSRVTRGRYWDEDPQNARSARRNGQLQDSRDFNNGFRVVLSPATGS